MKGILLHAATLIAAGLLVYIAKLWFEAEWLFGLLTVCLSAAFLLVGFFLFSMYRLSGRAAA